MQAGHHVQIDRIAMTGPSKKLVEVPFTEGVNIIWGASNAGKSFVRKAIDFVLGGDTPTVPTEGIGYDNFLLWLTLPKSGAVTLRRSIYGGDVYLANGHCNDVSTGNQGFQALKPTHSPQSPSVSKLLLSEAGFRQARLLKNERAEKAAFSLRVLMRYLLVDETRMIDEKSVLLQHSVAVTSEDKGLIKFLLTDVDGASVETVRSADQMKAARDGKVELLSQMAESVRKSVDPNLSDDDVLTQIEIANTNLAELHKTLVARQDEMDNLTAEVRNKTADIDIQESRIAELNAMAIRFAELSSVYKSDIERLSGIEEGGFLLQKFAKMNCPLCGAVPEHQHHDHGAIDVEAQRLGVESEIKKISRELNEIQLALDAADTEVDKRVSTIGLLNEQKTGYEKLLKEIKTEEIKARSIYLKASEAYQKLESELESRRLLSKYEAQIQRISSEPVKARQRAEGLDLNLNLTTNEANELSTVIKSVLTAWNYPGGTAIHFSPSDQDIVVDGKRRRDNGAGIRAILHSAFKVAVLLYCREKGRPHPGFLILDAPLLAYRPAEETRYGDLTDEEKAVVKADLAGHFYRHLHSLKGTAQFIVIENHKSDQDVVKPFPNVQFTRNPRTGRTGFFH